MCIIFSFIYVYFRGCDFVEQFFFALFTLFLFALVMIMMMKDEIDNSTSYHDDFQTIFEVSNIKYKDEPGQSPL